MTVLALTSEQLPTPVGDMVLLTDAEGRLRALDWTDHDARMRRLLRLHYGAEGFALTARAAPSRAGAALAAYIAGDIAAIEQVETACVGTPFQRKVWEALRAIPAGQTLSYGALAARIGSPAAVRAVGLANGANPIGVVVPCHRVIGANGSLTGYGGGVERKRWLLDHERAATAG